MRLSRTLLLAGLLAAIGLVRLGGDLLTDIDPTWAWQADDTPLRYLIVRVTDGSVIGDLNVQYFKLLAIPCGLSVVFLLNAGLTGGIGPAARRWADSRFRLAAIVALAAVCALCERASMVELRRALRRRCPGIPPVVRAWLHAR